MITLMPKKNKKMHIKNAKLVGITILIVTFLFLGLAVFLNEYMESDLFSPIFNPDKTPRHYVTVEMISSAGNLAYSLDLKLGFLKRINAKRCRDRIPRIKNEILMLNLEEDIKSRDMEKIKQKLKEAVCKHCPEARDNILLDDFWQQ